MKTIKKHAKGFVTGILAALLILSAGAVFANPVVRNVDITFRGIRIVVDGEQITPRDGDGNIVEPFILDGTTYLPVRAVADAVGYNVRWDGATSTVYLTMPTTPAAIALPPMPTPSPPITIPLPPETDAEDEYDAEDE